MSLLIATYCQCQVVLFCVITCLFCFSYCIAASYNFIQKMEIVVTTALNLIYCMLFDFIVLDSTSIYIIFSTFKSICRHFFSLLKYWIFTVIVRAVLPITCWLSSWDRMPTSRHDERCLFSFSKRRKSIRLSRTSADEETIMTLRSQGIQSSSTLSTHFCKPSCFLPVDNLSATNQEVGPFITRHLVYDTMCNVQNSGNLFPIASIMML